MKEASGERFVISGLVPGVELQYHVSRYQFAAGYARRKDVLDVACGTGYGACLLSQVASHVIGGDISLDSLLFALRRYQNANLKYVCLDAQRFPFRDSSFDVVVSLETVEHLVEPQGFLHECVRVLRPGGVLVLSTPNEDSHFWLSWVAQRSPLVKRFLGRIGGLNRLLMNPFHYREFNYRDLKLLVGSCLDITGFYGMSRLSQSRLYIGRTVGIAGVGRVVWEATKLIGFIIGALLKGGTFVDANALELRADAPVEAPFIPFALDGPGPVEYFIVVGQKRV